MTTGLRALVPAPSSATESFEYSVSARGWMFHLCLNLATRRAGSLPHATTLLSRRAQHVHVAGGPPNSPEEAAWHEVPGGTRWNGSSLDAEDGHLASRSIRVYACGHRIQDMYALAGPAYEAVIVKGGIRIS